MLKHFIIFSSLFILFSCGKSVDEKTAEAVLSANIALGKGNCQVAINVLEANGRVNDNAPYLKTLASAYACRAGYSTVTFFVSDLALTATPAPLGGTTTYSTSLVSATSPLQTDVNFSDLQTAIDILLYAGSIRSNVEPTSTERAKYFSTSEAADINSQLLYMMFVQLGKFMHVYGNGSIAGLKGAGAAANKCFTSYTDAGITDAEVLAAIALLPAECRRPAKSSHVQLTEDTALLAAATRKTRLCQGVVLLNGISNILPAVVASASGDLATQVTAVDAAASAASAALTLADASIGEVSSTINQTRCEDNTIVPVSKIETYYALMYETMFQP